MKGYMLMVMHIRRCADGAAKIALHEFLSLLHVQLSAALRANCSPVNANIDLAMIESGDKQANFETIWRIANALSVPPHVLVLQIEQEAEACGSQG